MDPSLRKGAKVGDLTIAIYKCDEQYTSQGNLQSLHHNQGRGKEVKGRFQKFLLNRLVE